MSTYKSLGPRRVTGTNPSGDGLTWVISFDPSQYNVSTMIPYFEVYKIVELSPAGCTFDVAIDAYQWDVNVFGGNGSWDPNEPMLIQPGQTVSMNFTYTVKGDAPTAIFWLRYDEHLLSVTP